jgi:hypothetical protein
MSGLKLDVEPFLEFVGAQLDEDEAAATSIPDRLGPEWVADAREVYTADAAAREIVHQTWSRGIAEHIARYDPARVLREVKGIREIIHKAVQYEQDGASPGGNVFGYHATGLFTALRHIAESRYADRPGYRGEWRP